VSRSELNRPELIGRLTPAQEGIFLDSLVSTAPGVYLLQMWCEIHGPLDAAALRRAWGRLAARHQVLRTSFHHEGLPHPVQVVHRSVEIPWEEEDWRGRPEAAARQALEARREADVQCPVHLERAPLLRVLLVRLEEDRWWLLSTQHHLILDGWSQSVVLRELFALYGEETGGPAAALPPPRPFAECVAWLRGRDPGAAEAFWRRALAGFRAPTPLAPRPVDHAVRGGPPGASGEAAAWLDAAATARLGELARELRVTPGALVHAAWLLLLARRSGEEDVCCGAVVATRPPHLAVEPSLVGMLVNTLPLRVRAALDRPLGAWLAEAHSALLDLREHAAAPPAAVRAWSEVRPGAPLFESAVAFESYPVDSGATGLPGLEITEVRSRESAPFPLTLAATPGARLRLDLLYDRARFDPAEAGRIVDGLEIVLRSLPGDPERWLADLPLLDEAGRHQVLTEWNDTAEAVPAASVLDLFSSWVERTPDAPALLWEGGELTYAELERRSTEEAARLRAEGVGPEVPVPVTGDRSAEWIVSYLAVAKAGGVYVPVDVDLPEERRRAMLGPLAPWPPLPSPPSDRERGENAPSAYLFYTSGSTGRPKGVWVDGRGLASFALDQARRFGARPGDRVLQLSAPGFDGTLWEIWTALGSGAALCLAGRDETLPGPGLADLLRTKKITHLFLPPSSLAALPLTELPELRALAVGGEALPADLARRWARGRFLANVYGPTEATVWVMAGAVDAAETDAPPLGRPLPNVRAYVLDRWLAPLPIDAPGEIWLGGPGLARGYLGQPDLTAERFVPNPFAGKPGGRLYRTGDRARLLPDGRVRFLGRLDAQVKVRGVRIEPAEVEAALRAVGEQWGVEDAAVIARDGRLVAYVTPREGSSGAVLRAALAERLPAPFVPSAYVRLGELPRTATGKLDRRALASLAEETAETEGASPPRTVVEGALVRIWGEVLDVEGIGREDDFWALGGHSLLAVRVAARVREELGAELPIRTLFEARTLASLAAEVEEALAGPGADLPPLVPVPRDTPLPLSLAQERLWLHERLEPGSYITPVAVRLEGRLDLPALIHALAGLATRHEALRTRFPARDGGAVQEILPSGDLPFLRVDLRALLSDRVEPELAELLRRETTRPFDLEEAPVWRAILAGEGPKESLLLAFHHIIVDGWSLAVFVRELAELYAAALAGRPAALPALPVQPADVAVWQRQWLTGEALEGRLAFWRDALAGFPTALDLPVDHPRPPVYRPRGGSRPLALPADLTAALRRAAERAGATPFLALLAGFAALLSRHTGQERIVIGAPVAGRRRTELESLFGFFVDTLPLPVDLAGEPSLAGLLARVREMALAAWAYQDLPFERLIADLGLQRDPSRPPLVQAMLSFDNTPLRSLGPLDLPGLTLTPLEVETGTAPFELSLDLADGPDRIAGAVEHAADLFDPVTADRFAGRFLALLAGALAEPDRPLAEVPAWSAAERHQVLIEWNDAQREGGPDLADLLAAPAARTPEAVALDDGERRWTYRELRERAAGCARHLRRRGVGPDVLVALVAESSPELIVGILGTLAAGGAFVPVDPAYPAERIAFLLDDARPAVILTREEIAAVPREPAPDEGVPPPFGAVPASCLAYVIHTSGSTGRPKGVMIPRAGLVDVIAFQERALGLTAGSRVLQLASPSFDAALWEILVTLVRGAQLHLAPRAARLPGQDLALLLRARRITHLVITPSALAVTPEADLPDLAVLDVGAEAFPPALARRWAAAGRRLFNVYGPTEATIGATAGTVDDCGGERLAVGRPIGAAGVWLLDRALRPVPAGVPGELCLGGAGLARGYLHRPDLTAERFLPHPFGPPGGRLYRSGDLARHRPDGTLEILGRIDGQLKVRGVRVEPGEVEATLAEHPAVREVAVALDAAGRLAAFVAPAGERFDAAGLRAFLRARLPEPMVPSAFVRLDALPVTPSGKVDRRALAELSPETDAAGGAFADPVTEILAGIWGELLGAGRIGPEDDFFDLGGHSLLAARVVARVREVLGVELPLRALFEAPTLAGMAERVRSAEAAEAAPPLVPVPRDGDLPLSFAQQRLWFLDQLRPGDPAYNLPHALALDGALDGPALMATLAALVGRHEALRTTFGVSEGRAVQVVSSPSGTFPTVDLTALSPRARRAEARRLAGEEALRPFDLARGPVLRRTLLDLGAREHHLLLTVHHIAADGWSIGLLVRELGELYSALVQGRPPSLPAPRLQYADYAVWQRQWLAGEVLERQISWWTTALAGAPAVLELPSDRPRRPVRRGRGGSRTMELSEATAVALRALVRREGASLFMGLFAAWGGLLARHAGQPEVVLGTPVANRPRPELEEIVGFFVNTLALSLDLRGAPSFRDLLAQARTTTLGAWAHQDLPFERLVDELGLERDLSHTPLFQHVLALQNAPVSALELPGLTLRPVDVDETAAKYDLLLSLAESPGNGFAGVFEYDADLFDPPTIDRLADRFNVLLAAALAAPDHPVQDLPLWTDSERHQIVHEWNGLASEAAVPTLHELFERQVALRPQAVAVTCGSESLTYGGLNARADRLAERLRAAGAGPGTLAGLAVERSLDLVVGILGILKTGAAYLPLDPDYPRERLALLLEDSGALVVVEPKDLKDSKDPKDKKDFLPSCGSLAESAAYVIYTSGSTGRPKGVPVTHANVARLLAASADLFAFGPDDVWTLFHSFAFDFSVWEIWGALAFGGRLVVVPYWVSRSPDLFWELLVAEGVTVLNQTPSAFRQLIPVAGSAASAPPLRWVVFGGEALDPASLRPWFHHFGDAEPRLVNMYGITETTVHVTFRPLTAADADQPTSRIGRALPHLRAVLLDASLQPLPIGVPGELCVGGAGVARGYLGRPELTAERFLPDPFGGPGERLYRSGDLARWRPDGDLEYLGRIDAQVKVRGFRIEPGEVEAALAEHPEVREAAVVLREGPGGTRQLAAFVAAPGAGEGLAERLRGFLRERLPEPFVPALFVLLPTLPLTAHGKVDRLALAALSLTPEASAPAPAGAPRTPAEEILTAVWAEVLGTRPGLDDSFFALGGDSILSLQVRAQAAERGLAFSLQDLFEHQTVRSLARALEGGVPEIVPATAPFSLVAAGDRERLPADLEDAFPLSSLQSGFVFHSGLGRDWLVYLNSLHLRASFDAGALREAVASLLRRHPMLRTSFAFAGLAEPLQLVHRTAPEPLEIEDLRNLPAEEREARITAWTDAELVRPFDWTRAPLIRFHVHWRTDETFQLTMSEPFLDGWSVATCLTELLETYLERVEPARPSVTYRDFVALERAALASPEARAWWERTLDGATATTLAPGAAGSSNVVAHPVPLSRETGERLARLAAAEALPLKSVLLAAHLRALGAATGRTDVVTGLLVNGRPEVPDGERVLGVFLNSLPFRLRFDDGSWTGLARRAFAVEREMLPYRRFPLAELQRTQGALFDTLFNFTHFHVARRLAGVPELEVLGVRSSEQTYFTLTAHFDLDPGTGSLALSLIYDAGRLSAIEIERLAALYARVLAALATDPAASWDASSPLAEEERHQLLVEANDTGEAREDGRRLHDLVRAQVERTPEAVALIWEEERLTYRDLWAQAEAVAARLRSQGTEPGARVVVCLERGPELIATLLGVLLAEAAYVPVDPAWPRERRELIAEDSSSLPSLQSLASLDLAYVLYTSGSTGRPKGVEVTHRSAVALLDWAAGVFEPDELAGVLAATSISFDLSVFEIFLPLSRGGTVILARDVLALPGLPAAEEVTLINTVPSALAELLRAGALPPRIRTVCLAGEALPQALAAAVLARDPAPRLWNLYGPTEATTYSTAARIDDAAGPPPIGRPIAGTRAYLLDPALGLVPAGAPGEIFLAGAGLARGYLDRPERTAEAFLPDPFSAEPGARMYRTGDFARRRPDGALEHLGRLDAQAKVRGVRIEPGEVEAALERHPDVHRAVVAARRLAGEREGERQLVAWVVPRGAVALASEELRGWLAERLPAALVPAAWMMLPELPLTPTGKVDRAAPPAPRRTGGDRRSRRPLSTPVEESLGALWEHLLGAETPGADDDFFALGGHSLLALRLAARVRDAFGVDLSLPTVLEARTLGALADRVEAALREGALPPEPIERFPDRSAPAPLTFAQERFWILDRLTPGNPAYHVSGAFLLAGPLEISALAAALDEVIRRHEALRTRFAEEDGAPVQIVEPPAPFPLPVADLSGLAEPEEEARREACAEARRPFDLAQGPVARGLVLRLDGRRHVLALTFHHIVADGWSVGLLVREVAVLYAAFREGRPSPLPELPVQVPDYARWQRRRLTGETVAARIAWWRHELGEDLEPLDLPSDRPRPPRPSFSGGRQEISLDAELTAELRALGRGRSATLFMTLLAGFAAVLGRWSGEAGVRLGTPVARRERTEVEGLVGLFLNTLVLRVRLDGDPAFAGLVDRARAAALGAYAHGDLPFERLVDALRPERDLSHAPLFQALLALQSAPADAPGLPDLDIHPFEVDRGTAQLDLALSLEDGADGVAGVLEYATDLFDAATAGRLTGHLETLLRGAAAAPETRLAELPLLSGAEQQQLLEMRWGGELAVPAGGVLAWIAAQAARNPEAPAVITPAGRTTYCELLERAGRVAAVLRRRGVGPETRVAVRAERTPETLATLLGIWMAGGAYVPLDPAHPEARLRELAEDAGALLVLAPDQDLPEDAGTDDPGLSPDPDHLAYVIYTSGSTGRPKGVAITHGQLAASTAARLRFYGEAPAGFVLLPPLSFDSSVAVVFWTLAAGGALLLPPEPAVADLPALGALLRTGGATHWLSVPSLWAVVLEQLPPEDLAGLRTVIVAGEACPRRLVEIHAAHLPETALVDEYGPTEATVWCTVHLATPDDPAPVCPVGRPIPGARIDVLGPAQEPAPLGVPGELWVAGPGVARGYLGRPDLTADRFRPDPEAPGARRYRTGDRVRRRTDGVLDFLGRLDEQVKIRGVRIEPGEVEATLTAVPGVRAAAVVAAGPNMEQRLAAFFVPEDDLAPDALRGELVRRLPAALVPASFTRLDALPLTPNGKVDRRRLAALADALGSGAEKEESRPPGDGLELRLLHLWEEVLGAAPLGVDDDFFACGGHSLLAVRLAARIARATGRSVPLAALFRAPTVARLAAWLREEPAAGLLSPLVLLRAPRSAAAAPPFFWIHPLGGSVLCYRELALHLGEDREIWGLEAPGLEAGEPLDRIEDLAAFHLAALREERPQGPYLLGAWSFGGLVALEMARRLEDEGEDVPLVALLDTALPGSVPGEAEEEELRAALAAEVEEPEREPALRLLRVALAHRRAEAAWTPRRIPAGTVLFRAAAPLPGSLRPPGDGLWPGVRHEIIPGNHFSLLQPPHVRALADLLRDLSFRR